MSLKQYDDEYLLNGLKESDPVVFKLIYKLHWQKLYKMAFYYLQNEADAEDAIQDVFISLWSRRERLILRGPLENYLVRSAKYTAFFYLKLRQKRQQSSQASTRLYLSRNNVEENMNYKSLMEQLQLIMGSVSQKTREIFFLSQLNGLSYKEIADQLGVSIKTVEYHISKALKLIAREEL